MSVIITRNRPKKEWREADEVRKVVDALLYLGFGRPELTRILRQMGYTVSEAKVRGVIVELRDNYAREVLPMVLGDKVQYAPVHES